MAPVKTDGRRPMVKRSKVPGWSDAVVIMLIPLMRRFVLFSKVSEPADQSGFRLFRKTHHLNLLALPFNYGQFTGLRSVAR